jgi:hypothetical protein
MLRREAKTKFACYIVDDRSGDRMNRIMIYIPRRCGARIRKPFTVLPSGAVKHRSPHCRAWAMPNGKCRVHGGATRGGGPQTPEGKALSLAARVEGRARWLTDLKAKGLKAPCGRKPKLRHDREAKVEAERVAAMPPIDRQREAALAAIAQMKANLRANMKARCDG